MDVKKVTQEKLNELLNSVAYKKYELEKERRLSSGPAEERKSNDEDDDFIKELEDKEFEIYDD